MTNCGVLGCGCLQASLASALVTLPRKVFWDSLRAEDTTGYLGSNIRSFNQRVREKDNLGNLDQGKSQ